MLTKRETSTLQRVAFMKRAADVIGGFVKSGFGTVGAVHSIVKQKYPRMEFDDVSNFWNFRRQDNDVLQKMEKVFESIKSE